MPIPQQCREVLVQRNLSVLKSNRAARLFAMSLVNRDAYSRLSTSAEASVLDIFSGGYNNFEEHVARERQQSTFSFSEDEAASALTLTGLPGAVEAWRQCMLGHKVGLFSWLEGDPRGQLFILNLEWAPSLELSGQPLTSVVETISALGGSAAYEENILDTLRVGELKVGIRRDSPAVTVRGRINAVAGVANRSTSFFIPPYVAPTELKAYYLSDNYADAVRGEPHNVAGGLQVNRVAWQSEVWIAGIRYERALGMHAPNEGVGYVDFNIPKGARYFRSIFGMAAQGTAELVGRAAGRVYIDRRLAWQAIVAGAGVTQTGPIGIPEGASVLRLEVDSLGSHHFDHTTWADPYFSAN